MTAKTKVLVIIGGDPRFHDFKGCGLILKNFLSAGNFDVTLTEDRNALISEKLRSSGVCVFFAHGKSGPDYTLGKLTAEQETSLLDFVKKGGGFVGIHCASIFKENKGYIDMLGSSFRDHAPYQDFTVNITDRDTFITSRIQDFTVTDELYFVDCGPDVRVIASARWQGKAYPMVCLKDFGKGKVCYIAPGHDAGTFLNPSFRKIALRSVNMAAGRKEAGTVNGAVIGYGGAFNMGKCHLDMMNSTAGLRGIAACDVDPKRMEAAQKEVPGVKTYTDYNEMLKNREIKLVTVITPHNTHAPIAMDCLKAGKNVVLEKPMCITTKEATAMINLAKKNGVTLSVFHNRRWDGDYLAIEEVIKKGMIGNVFHSEIFIGGYSHPGFWWRSDKNISGGALYDWGAHLIYWTLGLIPSKIRNVTGFFHKRVWRDVTNEDQTQAVIRFENGACADIQVSSIASVPKPRWRILGEKGGITDDWGKGSFKMNTVFNGVRADSEIKYKATFWNEYYCNVADHLVLGEKLEITPESARRVIGVIEAAEKSSKSGEPCEVPYE